MKTSLFTLVLHKQPFEDAIKITAELGFEGIEPRGAAPHLPVDTPIDKVREYAGMIKDLGLKVSCLATYTGSYTNKTGEERQATLDDLKTYLEFAKILDCDLLRHGPGHPSSAASTPEHWQIATEWMTKACDVAADANCRLAMELHFGGLVDTPESTLKLLQMVNKPNLGVTHDAGNMYITPTHFKEESVSMLGKHIFHVHVKDELLVPDKSLPGSFQVEDRFYQHKLLGEGGVDHLPAFKALKQIGYTGYLSCECHGASDDQEAVARHEIDELRRLISLA